jgi:signal transduction histidine kinase/DNA-binding response OmpR family regulator
LGSNEFNYGSFAKLSGGYLAFGGVDGVAFFNPSNIERQRHLPKIVLDELQLLNRRTSDKDLGSMPNIQTAKSIVLRHDENTFSIRFAGVLHSIPSKVSYSWIMEGLSEGWSVPSEQDFISFTNVPPGKYTFRVKAANRDGAWGPVRVLRVSIAPPWYATNLAYIIYALLAVALMVALGNLVSILIQKRNAEEQIAFFSNITHEIKTPLSILLSTLESSANKQEATSAGSEKLINTIKRMNALFEQLLNFNKVASQKMLPGSILKLDMRSYLDRMVKNFEPMQLENNIKVTIIDEWQKDVFYYDKDALDKILYNLYSNAIKYCRKDGEIRIILNAWSNSGLRLTIQDNGIGIPKEQQKYIMKRYFRSRNAINSQLPGTGLGLMIAKNLAERDKGNITFNSVENQGTSFIVSLRNLNHLYYKSAIISGTAKLTDEVRDKVRTGKYSDAKILVVEDNDELRKIVADELGTHFQVYEADNGKAGLELIAQIYPDIVLTDLVMPKMDGLDLCRAIKADVNMNHIPVLMMTVLNNPEIKLESIEIGVSEFMEKPIDFNILLAKIINILEWQTKLRQHYQQFADQEYSEKYRNRREGEFLLQIESFILEKIQKEDLSVHDMCRHVGMSRTALYNKLVSMVGMSPQNFIIHTRMKYARKLLVEKNLSIKEVAMISGFSNPKYFSTAFKKYYKESPTAFVKKLQSSP